MKFGPQLPLLTNNTISCNTWGLNTLFCSMWCGTSRGHVCHSLHMEVTAILWRKFSLSTFMWLLGFKVRSLCLGGNCLLAVIISYSPLHFQFKWNPWQELDLILSLHGLWMKLNTLRWGAVKVWEVTATALGSPNICRLHWASSMPLLT